MELAREDLRGDAEVERGRSPDVREVLRLGDGEEDGDAEGECWAERGEESTCECTAEVGEDAIADLIVRDESLERTEVSE
jgi:hypothetical protein